MLIDKAETSSWVEHNCLDFSLDLICFYFLICIFVLFIISVLCLYSLSFS